MTGEVRLIVKARFEGRLGHRPSSIHEIEGEIAPDAHVIVMRGAPERAPKPTEQRRPRDPRAPNELRKRERAIRDLIKPRKQAGDEWILDALPQLDAARVDERLIQRAQQPDALGGGLLVVRGAQQRD